MTREIIELIDNEIENMLIENELSLFEEGA